MVDKLFYNTGIPACLWFLTRDKGKGRLSFNSYRNRENEIPFIDASSFGYMKNRKNRELSSKDIQILADIYHNWRSKEGNYKDIKGVCKSATLEEVKQQDYLLTPARYVGMVQKKEEETLSFHQKMRQLTSDFTILIKRGEEMDRVILQELKNIGIEP